MNDLLARLNAALDERERFARAAAGEFAGDSGWEWVLAASYDYVAPKYAVDNSTVANGAYGFLGAEVGSHIAANDPAHVLREVTAHRDVLRHHFATPAADHPGFACAWCSYHWPCFDVQALASIYLPRED